MSVPSRPVFHEPEYPLFRETPRPTGPDRRPVWYIRTEVKGGGHDPVRGTQLGRLAEYQFDDKLTDPLMIYTDDGVSGLLPFAERPEGARLLADAKAGLFDVLMVLNWTTISPSPLMLLSFVHEMIARGVDVIFDMGHSGAIETMCDLRKVYYIAYHDAWREANES